MAMVTDMTPKQKQRQIKRYNAAADRVEAKQGWTRSAISHIDSALQSLTQAVGCARFAGVVASLNLRQVADQARSPLHQIRRWCREMEAAQQSVINQFHAKARRMRQTREAKRG